MANKLYHMNCQTVSKMFTPGEGGIAVLNITLVWLLACVGPNVLCKGADACECGIAALDMA